MYRVNGEDLAAAEGARGLWGVSPFLCLWQSLVRNPRRALTEARRLTFSRRSWRSFSLQIHGRDFLADLYAASRDIGIRPFLMWGTLLGCVRENGFIRHDTDIDIGIQHPDYRRKAQLIEAMRMRGYRLRYDQPYKISFWGRDRLLHMDIDVFFPWHGETICLARHKGRLLGATFRPGAFDALREMLFGDVKVLVPEDAESVLASIYGQDWREPVTSYRSGSDLLNRLPLASGDPVPRLPD